MTKKNLFVTTKADSILRRRCLSGSQILMIMHSHKNLNETYELNVAKATHCAKIEVLSKKYFSTQSDPKRYKIGHGLFLKV